MEHLSTQFKHNASETKEDEQDDNGLAEDNLPPFTLVVLRSAIRAGGVSQVQGGQPAGLGAGAPETRTTVVARTALTMAILVIRFILKRCLDPSDIRESLRELVADCAECLGLARECRTDDSSMMTQL